MSDSLSAHEWTPCCALCESARALPAPPLARYCFCPRAGIVDGGYVCRKFSADPLKRRPLPRPPMPRLEPV